MGGPPPARCFSLDIQSCTFCSGRIGWRVATDGAVSFSSGVHTVYTPSYRLLYKGPPQWPLEAETGYPLTDGGIDAELSVRDIVVVYTRQ